MGTFFNLEDLGDGLTCFHTSWLIAFCFVYVFLALNLFFHLRSQADMANVTRMPILVQLVFFIDRFLFLLEHIFSKDECILDCAHLISILAQHDACETRLFHR